MNEDPNCRLCAMHAKSRTVCMPGFGTPFSNLHVYLDQPSYREDMNGRPISDDAGDLLKYFFARMGINPEQVYVDYVLKCRAGKNLPSKKKERAIVLGACSTYRFATLQMFQPTVIVTIGSLSAEAFLDAEIGKLEGAVWECSESHGVKRVWCAYSLNYLREKTAEAPGIYRILWLAAEDAGFKPRETDVPPFDWDSFVSQR